MASRHLKSKQSIGSIANVDPTDSGNEAEGDSSDGPEERRVNAFSFLTEEQDEREQKAASTPTSQKKKKKKKKKKQAAPLQLPDAEAAGPGEDEEAPPAGPPPRRAVHKGPRTKGKKKASTGWTSSSSSEEQADDEAPQGPPASALQGPRDGRSAALVRELCVLSSVRTLNPTEELKSLFGSDSVRTEFQEGVRVRGGRAAKKMAQRPAARRADTLKMFCDRNPQWPARIDGGQLMELVPSEERVTDAASGLEFRYRWTVSYRSSMATFHACVESGDPTTLNALLASQPFHADALWQLAEVARELKSADEHEELLQRLLALFESSWSAQFRPMQGGVQLPWVHESNRVFLLALFRRADDCISMGAVETAFHLARLVLALDRSDPLGTFYLLDHLAIRRQKYRFVQELSELPIGPERRPLADVLPNWAFQAAFSAFALGKAALADRRFRKAVVDFPHVAARLLDRVGVGRTPSLEAWMGATEETAEMSAAAELFLLRNMFLWKADEVVAWMALALSSSPLPPPPESRVRPQPLPNALGLARHAVLIGEPAVLRELPRDAPRIVDLHPEATAERMARSDDLGYRAPRLSEIIDHLWTLFSYPDESENLGDDADRERLESLE